MILSHFGLHYKHSLKRFFVFFLLILNFIIFQGCGTLPNGRRWGQDATLTPGWERIRSSAVNAALSVETWMPVAASVALQINDMDQRISDWASENNPVFGSMENAEKWSSYLRDSSAGVYFITTIATPSGDDASDWLKNKARGLAIGLAASEITGGSTSLIKRLSARTRPDGSNNKSFLSGHASGAAALTTLSRRNLDSISLSTGSRMSANIAIAGIAVGTGWARVEAKKHYPSDVLAGYALGHFFSAFINDAFLGLEDKKTPQLAIEPSRKGIWIGLNWVY